MSITCQDRDRIFADGSPAEWAALETHAAGCAVCAEELRAWKALTVAAAELRDYSDSPSLWQRIQQSLAGQAQQQTHSRARRSWAWLSQNFSIRQVALAAAILLIVLSPIIWQRIHHTTLQPESAALLRKKALNDVERTQSAYVDAINKLAAEAKPQLDNAPETPLMANYREKLLVLDSAISDLQAQAGQNPSNAHLRYQLLAMYEEERRTLEEVLEEKR